MKPPNNTQYSNTMKVYTGKVVHHFWAKHPTMLGNYIMSCCDRILTAKEPRDDRVEARKWQLFFLAVSCGIAV